MNNYPDTEEEIEEGHSIDLLALFFKYLSYWKIFLASVAVCMIISVINLKKTTPLYHVTTKVLLKDDKKGGGTAELGPLKELGMINAKNNVDNEMEVLKTSNLSEVVVRELGLYVTYSEKGTFRDKTLYGDDCPVRISLSDTYLDTLKHSLGFEAVVNQTGLEFKGKYRDQDYLVKATFNDSRVVLPFGTVYINKAHPVKNAMTVDISIQKPAGVAKGLLGAMTMELTTKTTSVVDIILTTPNVEQGKDFLFKLIEVYNREDMKDQNQVAYNTDKFVSNRLDSLQKELKDVELEVENYKQKQGLTDIKSEADLFLKQTGDIEQKRIEVETQLAIISDIDAYMHKKENRYKLLPAGMGLESEKLNGLIADYNKLVLEHNRYSRIATGTNQSVIDLTDQIDGMFSTIQMTVRDEKRNLQIARQDLVNRDYQNAGRIKDIPRQEREYTEIKRQQGIKEALYVFLLQKKEENSLNMVIVVPKAKMIDTPSGDDAPISPNKMMILLMGFLLGMLLPIIGLFIRDMLRYHIENKEELEKLSMVPILGEIAKSEQTGNIIIRENSTNRFTEMFRLLRTNLLFVMAEPDQKVINVVSSISGEGKTFISINLAMSLALLDKKVLIIGLDIRKPKLGEYLGLSCDTGISLFLSGNMKESELIQQSGIHPNLSVITAGPVPPNPSELMARPSLDVLIASCKEKFDYIILDTAPIGVVSDAFSLNRFADMSLYIVRADYTPKKNIEDATKLFKQMKLNRMYFLLNAADFQKASFRYGYGKRYGYGYGNKYGGYGYGEK